MRYRKLDANGDYLFGQANSFYVDEPEGVAQAILTRLLLWAGEWFLDTTEGTDYYNEILGYGTQGSRDAEVRRRILETPGVSDIVLYSSSVVNRKFNVSCTVSTQFGTATVTATLG